jgi:hypothetical protein
MFCRNFWFVTLAIFVGCSGLDEKDETSVLSQESFEFSANVRGLNGGLVLSNNGKNNFTIEKNGEVIFPNTWALGDTYEIKVLEEPCLQRCVIDRPQGNVSNTGSLALNINCESKRWELPSSENDFMSLAYSDAELPSMDMNHYGDTLLTWFQSDGFNKHLYKKEFINRHWSNLNSIVDHFSFDGTDSSHVSVGLSDNMDAGIVWQQKTTDDDRSVYLGEKIDTQWNFSPTMLNVNGGSSNEYKPIVRINSAGEKIVVWSQKVGATFKLFKAEYRNGAWDFPNDVGDRISLDSSDVKGFDAAINDLGESVIAWSQSDGNDLQIYKAERRNGLPWIFSTSASNNFSAGGSDVGAPIVAMNNVGDAYITWYQDDPNGNAQIFVSQTHDAGQNWDSPGNLSDNINTVNRDAVHPKVVVNDQGQVVIHYRLRNVADVYQSYVLLRENSGSGWSNIKLSVADFDENQGNAAVGMDEFGNIVAAWSSADSGDVYKAERRNGSWYLAQENAPINTANADYNLPAVSVNNCRSSVAWQQEGPLGQKAIFLQQYR